MEEKIYLFDTTLRDGQQTTGVNFSVSDKMILSQHLDELGIDYIEGGWPGANPTDNDYFSRKLKTEELLFGETQGLVLVTIKENDLMEFERICMAIGVPATTIGRVTDDGFYTFNKSIKLPVKKLN